MRLAEVLVQRGLASREQMRSIPGVETMEDAELGTALVEGGVLTCDQLALGLSALFGVPPALDGDFLRADPSLRKRLRAHQASSFKCIPLYATQSRRVAVAMVDPGNPKIVDELAFVLGAAIEPMVTSETVLGRQLELLYAMHRRRTTGFHPVAAMARGESGAMLANHIPREESRRLQVVTLAMDPAAGLAGDPAPVVQAPMPPARAKGKKATQSYLSAVDDMPRFVPADPNAPNQAALEPQTPVPPMVSVTGPDRAVEMILSSPDRQAAADNLFAFMRSCFGAGAMFAISGVFASGRFGYNDGVECPAVESLLFSLSLPSCFRTAHTCGSIFHGAPQTDGEAIHGLLWTALRCPPPREVLVAPVVASGQVSLLLYAHGRNHGRMEKSAVSRMEHVCAALANTLVRLAG
jgi:hypothetical protein